MNIYEIRRDNARHLSKAIGGDSAFAAKIDRSTGQIAHIIGPNPHKNIGHRLARHIEQSFGKPEGWLDLPIRVAEPFPAYQVRAVDGEDGVDPEQEGMITVKDFSFHAGPNGPELVFAKTEFKMPFRIEWMREKNVRNEADIMVTGVYGSSMEPTLYHGDKVVINIKDREVISGATYAIGLDNEALIKRLFRRDGGVLVTSDNIDKATHPDVFISPDEQHRLCIVGAVIDKSGSGGLRYR